MPTRAALRRRPPSGAELVAVPAGVRPIAEVQAGVVTRAQLRAAGLTPARIENELAARRWRSFGRTVVVLHNGPLSPAQRHWVAVMLLAKPAALAGLSAATVDGLTGFEPEDVHVLVSHDTHVAAPAWVRLHESRRFRPGDICRGGGPPRTRIARSVIDAATWSAPPRRACAILCAAVQQRLTTADRLEQERQAAGAIRHVRIMHDILGDISGGGHTLAEIDLGPLAVRAGLAPPRRQALRREPNGKVRYVDAEFDLPDRVVLAVEIDGAVHLKPESWWSDMDRQNEIVISGSPMLRFSSLKVRLEQRRVVDQLRRIRIAHTP